jgi:site-specific recombinase XerD
VCPCIKGRKHDLAADLTNTGAYVIRHSLAVHLLRNRHPLKTITDMLGHRDPSVAYHYAKLDTEDLRDVALEVRGVLP